MLLWLLQEGNVTVESTDRVAPSFGEGWGTQVIHGTGRTASEHHGHDAALLDYDDVALQQEQAALCLSSGGMRCAAFSLDIDIEFDLAAPPISCEKQPSPLRNFAFAKINCRASSKLGEPIYRKPVDLPAVSMDDSAYLTFQPPTLDQFLGESQFENYRQLARHERPALTPGTIHVGGAIRGCKAASAGRSRAQDHGG
jgi:hypothetical protein